MILTYKGKTINPARLHGWRGVVVRWLLRRVGRLLSRIDVRGELAVAVVEPTTVELQLPSMVVSVREKASAILGELPTQPVVPEPLPLSIYTDRRAGRYAYKNLRKFASDDFDAVKPGDEPHTKRTKR